MSKYLILDCSRLGPTGNSTQVKSSQVLLLLNLGGVINTTQHNSQQHNSTYNTIHNNSKNTPYRIWV